MYIDDISLGGKTLILGPVGSGKTTLLKKGYLDYIDRGYDSSNVLVLVMNRPQSLIWRGEVDGHLPGRSVRTSFFGFVQKQLTKYWPKVLELCPKIERKSIEPTFLSFEASQHLMNRCLEDLRQSTQLMQDVSMSTDRAAIELTATLSRAALANIPYDEIGSRLKAAANMDRIIDTGLYEDIDRVLSEYIDRCLREGALDYGIAVLIYKGILLPNKDYIKALHGEYKVLIVDNLEEMAPAATDLVAELLKGCEKAILSFCTDGGYSKFYGADPKYSLERVGPFVKKVELSESFTCSKYMSRLADKVSLYILDDSLPAPTVSENIDIKWDIDTPLRSQMIDELNDQIWKLIDKEGYMPGDIAIIAPFVDAVLECSIVRFFEQREIEVRNTSRKRRAMDNPYTNAMIVLSCLAHPSFKILPSQKDIADTVSLILGIDPVRSGLIAKAVTRQQPYRFPAIEDPLFRERVGFDSSDRYEYIRNWLLEYKDGPPIPIDDFFKKVFLEILIILPEVYDNLIACSQMIDTARAFIESLAFFDSSIDIGRKFILMFKEGAKQSESMIDVETALSFDGILLTTPIQYLSTSRHKKVQIWCDIRSTNWTPRDAKVFTNPQVLSTSWRGSGPLTEEDEEKFMREKLSTIINSLLKRCEAKLILTSSQYSSQGFEESGLLSAIWREVLG
ncbi:MAG: hypothetical protein GX974_03350 [Clostridiales bacterium]|nr:hypothetical protein [Clostridiales bacterium]